ncbi:MAG: hypothetical protein GSR81_05305 [Desulfurococcales archaeon]|nr:hypothetical protein [Desulfurococcales archaeon]
MDQETIKLLLTVPGRILYYMGILNMETAKLSHLAKYVGNGVYSQAPRTKHGLWIYNPHEETITLTEKGKTIAQKLTCINNLREKQ